MADPEGCRRLSASSNLPQLIRYLRNAISHFNIEFLADGAGRLSGLRVWNVDQKRRTTRTAELSESDLDEIAHRFISLILREQQTGEGAV